MLGVYGQPAGDLTGGKPFPSLPTGGTIHSRVSEHRGHYHEVIIIHNHAVAEPDAGATWGYSQVLEGDGRADDNLKRGRFGRHWGEKGRAGEGVKAGQPSLDLATSQSVGTGVTSFSHLGQQTLSQSHRAPGSLRMRLIPVSESRPPPLHLEPLPWSPHSPIRNVFLQQRTSTPWKKSCLWKDLWPSTPPTSFKTLRGPEWGQAN